MDIEVLMPDIGVNNVEVTEILVNIGDYINKDDPIISVEGQKTVLEIPSSSSGIIQKIHVKIGDKISFKKNILTLKNKNVNIKGQKFIYPNKDRNISYSKILEKNNNFYFKKNENLLDKNIGYTTPNVRRLSRIHNINLSKILGSGRKGRIIKEDLFNFLKIKKEKIFSKFNKNDSMIFKNKNKILEFKNIQLLSSIQKQSAKNLLYNWQNIPHVTQFDEADITELEKFRSNYNKNLNKINNFNKISLLSFIVKAIIETLSEFPKFNSILDKDKKKIFLKKYINIGIAVETELGLVVPVLKNMKFKKINYISSNLLSLIKRAKKNQLKISDMQNGSFTISNLGGIGGTNFTPIINAPEVCILGVSKSKIQSVWIKKEFQPRLILPFSISYDHRVIDGADAVRFTTFFKNFLTDIRTLLI